MRLPTLLSLLGASALASASATDAKPAENAAAEEDIFNGVKVPPILELTPDTYQQFLNSTKFAFIKHYSPYCPHCIDFAPNFKTAYQFYYTSKPVGHEDTSFEQFYDFRFAQVNCAAYYDLCADYKVQNYPTTMLFQKGELEATVKGVKNVTMLSNAVEKAIEADKPGTRPKPLLLPLRGADHSPDYVPTEASSTVAEVVPATSGIPRDVAQPPKAKSTVTPNPDGASVSLTAETFQKRVTMTREPWFIKFYAPWCHHCKAMATAWEQLGREMKGKLNIGEVNCDRESRLCKEAHMNAYPSIVFFRGGERVEYDGLRGLGDLIQYAEKAVDLAGGIQDVDADSFKILEEKEHVLFVYFYDHAATTEDFMALERLPMGLIGRAKLVKTKDPRMYERFKISTWPRLMVSREGRPTYYTPLTPKEMRDVNGILNWMKSVWLPIVPELTASNAREIIDGKIVVLGILDREDQDSFTSAIREMKSAANEWMDKQIQLMQLERQELRDAKQLRIEEAEDRGDQRALRQAKAIHINMDRSDKKEVIFAWVDGVFWQRWIRTTYGIDVKDGERVIINDEDNRRYWDITSTGNYISPSRTSIMETITKVTASPPKIKPKLTIGGIEKMIFDFRVTSSEHPILTAGCVMGILFGLFSWLRGRLRRTRGGHFRLDDGIKDFKDGLLGGGVNTNGKVD